MAVSKPYLQQVVLKFRDSIHLPYEDDVDDDIARIGPWKELSARFPGITVRRAFRSLTSEQIARFGDEAHDADPTYSSRTLLTFFVVVCPPNVDPFAVAAELKSPSWSSSVETADVDMVPSLPCTLGFELPASKGGIDSTFAAGVPGGRGQCQHVIDLESGWTRNHDSIQVHGIPPPVVGVEDILHPWHGTAALSVICGNDPATGFRGIAPDVASVRVASWIPLAGEASMQSVADAILTSGFLLASEPGSVLVLEVENPLSQPVEVFPACFSVIRACTTHNVVVVEPAGNGSSNLDLIPTLNRTMGTFRDSLAIMVAAASSAAPHACLAVSNHGNRIDCYAWGDNVACANSNAPGDVTLYSPPCFINTSAATAIIGGAVLSIQGMAQASQSRRFRPVELLALLHDPASGTPGTGAIGLMPDLKRINQGMLNGTWKPSIPVNPCRQERAPRPPTNVRIIT
jgi:hypothetical protein